MPFISSLLNIPKNSKMITPKTLKKIEPRLEYSSKSRGDIGEG